MAGSPDARAATQGAVASTVLMAASRSLAFLLIVVATRNIETEGVARYSVVLAAATMCGILADAGTSTAITRLVSRAPDRAPAVLGGTLLASGLAGLVMYGLGFAYFAGTNTITTPGDWAVGGLQVVGAAVLSSLTAALAGHGELVRRAWVQFTAQAVSFGGGAVVLAAGGTVRWALAALAAGPVFGIVASIPGIFAVGAWPARLTIDRGEVRDLVHHSLPFAALAGMAVIVSRADLLLLAVLSDAAETTRYELAVRAIDSTSFVTLALATPAVFLLSRRLAVGDVEAAQRAFDVLTHTMFVLGVGLSALVAPLATQLSRVAYGSAYGSSGRPLAVLGSVAWATLLVAALGGLLTSSESPRKVVPLGVLMLVINGVLVAALLPPFEAVGAAVATAITQVLAVGIYARVALQLTGVRMRPPALRVVASGLVAAAAAWVTRDLPLFLPMALALGLYASGLLATGAVDRHDVGRVRQLLAR
ncbi:MAG: oligosaccharide flippase family protein [Acidimicrobiales bacterium]|nr:oligosaccharide flippase family protein [Acidimicrobiales bacterium]